MTPEQSARCSALWDSIALVINGSYHQQIRAVKDIQNAYHADLIEVVVHMETDHLVMLIGSLADLLED